MALASPSGSSSPNSQNNSNGSNAYPPEPSASAASSGSGYFGRGTSPPLGRGAGADSNMVRLHGVGSVSPPDRVSVSHIATAWRCTVLNLLSRLLSHFTVFARSRSRVELASHEHDATAYQLSDHLGDDSASSSSALPAHGPSGRMGRRRSSSSRGGLGRGLLGVQQDSNLARAQDPLLHRDEFVALDMEERQQHSRNTRSSAVSSLFSRPSTHTHIVRCFVYSCTFDVV